MLDPKTIAVRECMSPYTVSATPGLGIAEAAEAMDSHHVRHLPVQDEQGSLVGIVSDRDIRLAAYKDPDSELVVFPLDPVSSIMTPDPLTVPEDLNIAAAAQMLLAHRISSLVVERNGQLVGIVAVEDLLRLLAG